MSDQDSATSASPAKPAENPDAPPSSPKPPAKPKKSRAGLIVGIIAAVIAAVVLGAGIMYLTRSIKTRPVTVPSVLRLNQAAAANQITAAGLVVGTVSKIATSQVGVGLVVSQKPVADTSAPKGSAVDFATAVPPVDTSTPNLVGMQDAVASKLLTDHLFIVRHYREYSSTVPAGTVAQQLPAAGVPTQTGNQIFISVSLGPGKGKTVPNIVGLGQPDAAAALAKAGITPVWNFTNINPTGANVGTVIDQAPDPGTEIPAGEVVAGAVAIRQ